MGQKLLSGFSVPLLPKPLNAAKRYRVDVEKLQKAVAGELAAKLAKTGKDKSTVRSKEVAWTLHFLGTTECIYALRRFVSREGKNTYDNCRSAQTPHIFA